MKVILTKHLWKFFMFLFSKETPLNVQGVMASWGCALLVLAGASKVMEVTSVTDPDIRICLLFRYLLI